MKARIKNCLKKIKIGGYKLKDTLPPYFSGGFLIISLILTINLLILTANYPPCSNKILGNPIAKADTICPPGCIVDLSYNPPNITSTPSTAQNAIILVIDGLRDEEAFDDPTHQYIPHIWNDLRPQGTMLTNFWAETSPITPSGHSTLLTGKKQFEEIAGDANPLEIRPKEPTIFEYYRKQKDAPLDSTLLLLGKGPILKSMDYSLNPLYGYDYRGKYFWPTSVHDKTSDNDIWSNLQTQMDTYHPSLIMVNLMDVDHVAHRESYENYTAAIKNADQIVWQVWQKIQNDPYYKDKTDLIITTDHGRHSDGVYTGYKDHNCSCGGCRHIPFLALGPDVKTNFSSDQLFFQGDVAPTIGAILGFTTPYAEGKVMTDILNDPSLANNNQLGGQQWPKIAANSQGLHKVWSEPNGAGWDIMYSQSADFGTTWTPSQKILTSNSTRSYYQANIAAKGDKVYVVATGYDWILDSAGAKTFAYRAFGTGKVGTGQWSAVTQIKNTDRDFRLPAVEIRDDGKIFVLLTSNDTQLLVYVSADNGATWAETILINPGTLPAGAATNQYDTLSLASKIIGTTKETYANWSTVFFSYKLSDPASQLYRQAYNFFFRKNLNGTWQAKMPITANADTGTYLFNPVLAQSSNLSLIFSSISSITNNGTWQIQTMQSNNGGTSWINKQTISAPGAKAWMPDMKANGSGLVAAWEQVNSDHTDIYASTYSNSSWSTPTVAAQGSYPSLATYNGNKYMVWQEMTPTGSEIKFRAL